MSLMQFCPNCWTENPFEARTCERCGAELSETEMISSDQQLMQALHHPVPETREMAAIILGLRHDQQAVSVLMVRLQEEKDIEVLCAISKSLGQLGDCRAVVSLLQCLTQPCVLTVALTIVDALATLARSGCKEAWNALKTPLPVSERVAQEITTRLEAVERLYF